MTTTILKEVPDRPQFSLIWALFWDGGGIERGTYVVGMQIFLLLPGDMLLTFIQGLYGVHVKELLACICGVLTMAHMVSQINLCVHDELQQTAFLTAADNDRTVKNAHQSF